MADRVLVVEDLKVFYNEFQALFGVSLEVAAGETVAILGANGAGKTTLLNTIAGVLAPRRGKVVYRGDPVSGSPAYRLCRRGISMVPEGRRIFPSLTVEENLEVGAYSGRRGPWQREAIYNLFPILRERARVRAGETVLVTGASGGVGLHAIPVAKALGARVVAVTSSAAKAEALGARGADEVLVSADHEFHKPMRRAGGVDVVLDCVGAPTLAASMRSLKPTGRVVVVGNVTALRAELNPGLFILTEIALLGASGCTREDLADVLAWVREGRLAPVVAGTLPLAAAADAHRRLEARGVVGRLVLVP